MQCKANDWIRHADFGIGRVSQDRGDRLVIEFLNFGAMIILKTAGLKPAVSPPGVEYRTSTSRVLIDRSPFSVTLSRRVSDSL